MEATEQSIWLMKTEKKYNSRHCNNRHFQELHSGESIDKRIHTGILIAPLPRRRLFAREEIS
jgi:hypothetical protein